MNIGVTGGSGFIGRYIIEKLLERDISHNIKNIDINKPEYDARCTFIHGDIRDKEKINLFCRNLDCVIHLAAAHHDFGIEDEEYFSVNENGTKILLEAMENHDVGLLIFYSSVAVYGRKTIPADETATPNPENPYGSSKFAAERLIKSWVDSEVSRRAYIVRPTVVIGPRNLANMFFLIDQIYKKRYLFNFGTGENIKSVAHVKNLTDFTLFLLERDSEANERFSIFNYVDYPQLTIRENINIIHEELGFALPKVTIPMSLALLIGKVFDILIKITGRNLPISSARLKKIATPTHFEAKNIKKVNFIPKRSIESGITEMVQWYLDDYRKKH